MAMFSTRVTSRSRYKPAMRDYERKVKEFIGRAGNVVRNTAVQSINQGSKSGVVYELYNPRRTHRASASGEPPATDTGYLVNNIVITMDSADRGLSVNVESRAEYSSFLEFGTSKMSARPFMQPALEQNKQRIKNIAKRMIKARRL